MGYEGNRFWLGQRTESAIWYSFKYVATPIAPPFKMPYLGSCSRDRRKCTIKQSFRLLRKSNVKARLRQTNCRQTLFFSNNVTRSGVMLIDHNFAHPLVKFNHSDPEDGDPRK